MKHLLFLLALIPMIGVGQKKDSTNIYYRDYPYSLDDSKKVLKEELVRFSDWVNGVNNLNDTAFVKQWLKAFWDYYISVVGEYFKDTTPGHDLIKAHKAVGTSSWVGYDTLSPRRSSPEYDFGPVYFDTNALKASFPNTLSPLRGQKVQDIDTTFFIYYANTCNHKWVVLAYPAITATQDFMGPKTLICLLCHKEIVQEFHKLYIINDTIKMKVDAPATKKSLKN